MKDSQENTCVKVSFFSCELSEIFKNTVFVENPNGCFRASKQLVYQKPSGLKCSIFGVILSIFGVILVHIFPHSDQNNSEYGHFSRSESCRLRPATLLKMRIWHKCFPLNFVKSLRTPFL